jgi:hypothetical protein
MSLKPILVGSGMLLIGALCLHTVNLLEKQKLTGPVPCTLAEPQLIDFTNTKKEAFTGIVERVANISVQGNSQTIVLLKDDPNIFVGNTALMTGLLRIERGNKIDISALRISDYKLSIWAFEILKEKQAEATPAAKPVAKKRPKKKKLSAFQKKRQGLNSEAKDIREQLRERRVSKEKRSRLLDRLIAIVAEIGDLDLAISKPEK